MATRADERTGRRQQDRDARGQSRRVALLLLLAFNGGYVDALSYLGLDRVFTAAMTGNTVLLALAVAQGQTLAALRSGIALAGFVVGLVLAHAASRQRRTSTTISPAARGLLFELIALAALAIGWFLAGPALTETAKHALIATAALAMGLQSAAVRPLGVNSVATTYITGTLTSLTSELVAWIHPPRGTSLESASPSGRHHGTATARGPGLPAAVWGIYAVGAVAGGLGVSHWYAAAALPPLAAVAAAVAIEIVLAGRGDP